MIKYQVRSRDLIGVYNEIKTGRLIPDAYFQRNLVWRDIHKQDFIKTILLGYPFPQIFVSKGVVDVDHMTTTSCVVDGQQRCKAIEQFVDNEISVDGRFFKDLSPAEKSEVLKYEIAVIELDLDNNDPRIQDIFQRVNRTANSLTAIEKLASEYAPSEFMFFSRFLCDDFDLENSEDDFKIDPNIPMHLVEWAKATDVSKIQKALMGSGVFSERELIRKVHLQYTLNIVATILTGYFNRSTAVQELLENYSETFPGRELVLELLEQVCADYMQMKFVKKSMWRNKANFYTLIVEMAMSRKNGETYVVEELRMKLANFEIETPEDYKLAAKEGVNNLGERTIRGQYVGELIKNCCV